MAVQVFEVLSMAMTSSPEVVRIKKFSVIFGVFGPTESNSDVRFTCLRFGSASILTLGKTLNDVIFKNTVVSIF